MKGLIVDLFQKNFGFIFLASIKSVSSFLFSGYLGYMMRIDFLSDSLRTCRSLTYQRKIQLCSYIVLTKEESKRIYFTKDSSRKAAITFSYLDQYTSIITQRAHFSVISGIYGINILFLAVFICTPNDPKFIT